MRSRRGSALVLALTALLALAPTCGAPGEGSTAGDLDLDGVPDAQDTCSAHPNLFQTDSDHDGLGNACDADFDQNGLVGISDFNRIRTAFGARNGQTRYQPVLDLNSDGAIGLADFNAVRSAFGDPPGPGPIDADGDGVAPADDLCPDSIPGVPAAADGCSLLDVASRPDGLLIPVQQEIEALAGDFGSTPYFAGVRALLREAVGELAGVIEPALAQDFCEAARFGDDAPATLRAAQGAVSTLRRVAERMIPPDAGSGDITEPESFADEHGYWERRLGDAIEHADGVIALLGRACAARTPFQMRGRIAEIDSAQRRFVMGDGSVIAWARDFELVPLDRTGYDAINEGDDVDLDGYAYGTDGGVALTAGPTTRPVELAPVLSLLCLQLRVAPFQDFAVSDVELHAPRGYLANGRYRLERSARIAAESICSPNISLGLFARYSMDLTVSTSSGDIVIATNFVNGSDPVPLPPDLPSIGATLRAVIHRENCNRISIGNVHCGPRAVASDTDYPLEMLSNFTQCRVSYDREVVSVDDQDADDFATASPFGLFLNAFYDGGTSPVFEGEGYSANPTSSYPIRSPIHFGDTFALHNVDFVPLIETDDYATQSALIAQHGVFRAGGLRWPHIDGILNGQPFRYACQAPKIVRDVVNFCPGDDDDAYYKMPFREGDETWTQGQGNGGSYTHANGFAYDMVTQLGRPIHVARGGRVVYVEEGNSEQCNCPGCCSSNIVFIEHQDGNFTQYNHMLQFGVFIDEGEIVRRGELLGFVGVVGNTTGPHLHFAEKTEFTFSGSTSLALFEAIDPDDETNVLECYEPPNVGQGDPVVPLRSTNFLP